MTLSPAPTEVPRPMPDRFDPTRLVIAKAQAEDRAAADLQAEREDRAAARTQRRHLKPRPHEVTSALTSVPRGVRREARLYAASWYDALLLWRTREVKIGGSFHYDGPGTPPDVLLAGTNRPMPTVYLSTPAGEFDEAAVGQRITEMAREGTVETRHLGKLLDKLRSEKGNCLASLVREDSSWHQHRERATRYAVAVLTLAVSLRVAAAEEPLRLMQQELAALAHS